MKILTSVQIEKYTVILECGVDYVEEELELDYFTSVLLHLPFDRMQKIAKKNGFDSWSWSGCEIVHEETGKKGIRVHFQNCTNKEWLS